MRSYASGRLSWIKAATSAGVGGSPVRSSDTRRSRVVFDASGEGLIFSESSRARMKLSIGLRAHAVSWTAGGAGRRIGWKDQWRAGFAAADHGAPASIQPRIFAISAEVSGAPTGGITFFSAPETMRTSLLASLLPGSMT